MILRSKIIFYFKREKTEKRKVAKELGKAKGYIQTKEMFILRRQR